MRYKTLVIVLCMLLFTPGCENWLISTETLDTIKTAADDAKAARAAVEKKDAELKTTESKAVSKGIALTEAAKYANQQNPVGLPREAVSITLDTALESFAILGIGASSEDKVKALELANAKLSGDNAAVARITNDIRAELTTTKHQLAILKSERDILAEKYSDINIRFTEQIATAKAQAVAATEKYKLEKDAEVRLLKEEAAIKIAESTADAKIARDLLERKNTTDVCRIIALGLGGLLIALLVGQFAFHIPVNVAAYGYIIAGIVGVLWIPVILGTWYSPIIGTVLVVIVAGGLIYEMIKTKRKVAETKVTEHSFDEILPGLIKALEKLPEGSSGILINTLSETLGNTAKSFLSSEMSKLGKTLPDALKPVDTAK